MQRKLIPITVAIVLLLICATVHGAVSVKAKQASGMRCSRPFDALRSFKPKDMKHNENCDFGYLRVENITAKVLCGDAVPKHGDKEGCYVNITLNMTVLKRVEDDSKARYTLELRSLNHSVVNYKGMDNNGYSVCCSMLHNQPCDWVDVDTIAADEDSAEGEPKKKVRQVEEPRRCPLVNEETGPLGEEGTQVAGRVVKPLHKVLRGAWDARLIFTSGGGHVVGRVSVPFNVRSADVSTVADAIAKSAETSAVVKADVADDVAGGNETAASNKAAPAAVNSAEL